MSDHKMTSGEVEDDGRLAVASEEMTGTASEAGTEGNTQHGGPPTKRSRSGFNSQAHTLVGKVEERSRSGFNRQAHTLAGKVAALHKWKEEEGNPTFGRKELLVWYEKTYHLPLPKNTFRTWCKQRADIRLAASSIPPDDQEHVRRMMGDGKLRTLNNALFHWFESQTSKVNLTGPLIKHAAREIFGEFSEAEQEEIKRNTSFNFSDKWLAAWKRKYQIAQRKSDGGEAGSAPVEARINMPKLLAGVDPRRIFNVDESALLWKQKSRYRLGTPDIAHMMGTKQDYAKDRLTVNFAVNATGDVKSTLQVIGKHKNPHCFLPKNNGGRRWVPEMHGVLYHVNDSSWQNRATFTDFLTKLNHKLADVFKETFLFVNPDDDSEEYTLYAIVTMDNVPSHVPVGVKTFRMGGFSCFIFKKLLCVCLPPNTTSVVQPMDQGIIAYFKRKWREMLMSWQLRVLNAPGSRTGEMPSPNVREVMEWAKVCWDLVPEEVVRNCWSHSGILPVLIEQQFREDKTRFIKGDAATRQSIAALAEVFKTMSTKCLESPDEHIQAHAELYTEAKMDYVDDQALPPVRQEVRQNDYAACVRLAREEQKPTPEKGTEEQLDDSKGDDSDSDVVVTGESTADGAGSGTKRRVKVLVERSVDLV